MKFKLVFSILISTFTILAYQNCGDVSLAKPQIPPPVMRTLLSGNICVSDNASDSNFQLKRIYAVNVTTKMIGRILAADSDMDGLTDSEETASNLGLDPLNPRTHGILDSICQIQGGVSCNIVPGTCDPDLFLSTGVKDCDLMNVPPSTYRGLNSDAAHGSYNADVIPDYVELLRGTLVAVSDADLDYDGDLKNNETEIALGRDVQSVDDENVSDQYLMRVNYSPLGRHADCNNNLSYSLKVDPPLIAVQAFSDGGPLDHRKDENVILIYIIAENPSGDTEFRLAIKKINILGIEESQLILRNSDFILQGSY